MGSSNQKKKNVTSIDFEVVEYGFKSVARVYKCMICRKLPINPVQCINPDCEKFLCLECHVVPQRCIDCKELIPKTLACTTLMNIMKMIQVRCPQNCGLVDDLNVIALHYSLCDFEDKTIQPAAGRIEKQEIFLGKKKEREENETTHGSNVKYQHENKTETTENLVPSCDEKQDNFSNFIRNLVLKGGLDKKGLKNDMMLIKFSKEHFEILPEDQLEYILKSKNVSYQNSKCEMVSSLIGFFNILKMQNSDFKNKINIQELKESDLDYYLQLRNLPTNGNKSNKIQILRDYLDKII
jgi:hypothetical protein